MTNSPQIKWSSSVPSIATVSATGLVTGVSPGNVTITATLTNTDGTVVIGTASVTTSVTAAPEPLLSLTIIPSSITVGNLQATGQFLAIGTYSTPPLREGSNQLAQPHMDIHIPPTTSRLAATLAATQELRQGS